MTKETTMHGINYAQDIDGTWVATHAAPALAYRHGLIGRGGTKEGALRDLAHEREALRTVVLESARADAPGIVHRDLKPGNVGALTFGRIYDALCADGWAIKGRDERLEDEGTIVQLLAKPGHPDFLAHGGREELVGPAYAAAISAATGLDLTTIGRVE